MTVYQYQVPAEANTDSLAGFSGAGARTGANRYQHRSEQFEAETSPTAPPRVRVNSDAGVTSRVITRDGVIVSAESEQVARATSSELNPHHGDGTVFATATNPRGMFVREILPETLITVEGVQAPVSFWVSQGMVHKTAEGTYAEGPPASDEGAPSVDPQAETDPAPYNALQMPESIVTEVDRALDGVADHHLAPLLATGVGFATGQLDRATMVRQMVSFSGVAPAEAEARVSFVQAAYQGQADAAITNRCGVAPADLPGFYAWAKGTQKGALQDAVQKQVHASDFRGYRALADRYLAEHPPTIEAVKAGGFDVRKKGNTPEVFVDGRWMTLPVAARLGYF